MDVFDKLDYAVLRCLVRDSRRGPRVIGRILGKPASTVAGRIRRLEEKGVIERYTVLVNYEKLGYDITALILIQVEGSSIVEVEKELAQEQSIRIVYDITGEYDIAVVAVTRNMKELDRLVKKILSDSRIKKTYTSLVFRRIKDQPFTPP